VARATRPCLVDIKKGQDTGAARATKDIAMSQTLGAPSLIEALQDIRRRVKLFSVAYGAGVAVAAAAGLLLATVLIDWALNLPTPLRVVMVLVAAAEFGYVLFKHVLRPLWARLTIGDVAGRLEHAFPQFDDRLRSTVDFVRDGGAYVPGSDPMKQKVVAEAATMAQNVDLSHVIDLRPVWYSIAGATAATVVLVLLAVMAGANFIGIAANRLVGGAAQYPKSTQIDLVGTVPARVPVGRPVDVKMKLSKGAARTHKAVIHYRYDDGPWQKELMTVGADGTFAASLDARLRPDQDAGRLDIRLEAGDDEKELAPVTLVPRLDVTRVEARITPPPYAGQAVTAVNLGERPAQTAVGSTVDLAISFNKPLQFSGSQKQMSAGSPPPAPPVRLEPSKADQKAPQISWKLEGNNVAVGTFTAAETMRFTVRATDIDGFENTGTQEFDLVVREDAMPTVQVEEPRRSEDRTPEAAFPLRVVAEDDYGISQAQLVVRRVGGEAAAAGSQAPGNDFVINLVNGKEVAPGAAWTVTDDRAERKRFRLEYLWDLAASMPGANLKPGDVLEYFVQVRDNFDLDGKRHDFVASGKLRVTIISQEQFAKNLQMAFEQLHNELAQIKRGQTNTKVETEALAQQTKQRGKFDDADQKQAERLSSQQGTTAAQTKQTAGKLSDLLERMGQNKSQDAAMKQTAGEVSKQLEQAAEGAMKEASKDLATARETRTDAKATDAQKKAQNEQRDAALARAQENQDRAAEQIDKAMQRLGNFGGLSEAIARIAEIKKAQEALAEKFAKEMKDQLGKKPEDLDKKTQEALKKMAEEQKKLQAQTESALTDMNKKSEQMMKTDPSGAQAMKQAAQTGQQQGVPSKQQQASQAMQQNQQAQAQQNQKQAALGLEMILAKLKEAERRKLEQLAKQLEELQKLVADLVRRQAGHNLDNLTLDNPKKIADMTEAERDDLLAMSERDPQALPPPPTVEQLSASQEQTERNTRDVAKTAEALPENEPATKLTAAAGQMERAVVHLRAQKLPDAYSPPQVEALKALADAKAKIDEMKQKVDDQLQQQDRESIRQAYVKLLESQKKINKDTLDVDKTEKDPAGALPRLVAVRLGQLPGEQGKLSETAEGLGRELEKIGSIVYVWANKDIVRSMANVKDGLAKPDTGIVTQSEQTRVAEQLQAMIDNLVEKPKESKFAGKGGGQCKGGVKMPTETELRLLKGLQQAVNKNTQVIDQRPKKEDPEKRALVDLGGRQGELRDLLDQLMQKSSEGKVKLGPEPDNKEQLPEEASKQDVDDQEFEKFLREDTVKEGEGEDAVARDVKLTGDRMARSRQRLALNNDPGKVTQTIQEKIINDLDQLIELSRQQQMQMQNAQNKQQQQKQQMAQKQLGQMKLAQQQAQQQSGKPNKGGQNPANKSFMPGEGERQVDASVELREKFSEWGGLTQRERQAVMEGASEKVLEKYRGLVDDYYTALGKKATERKP
jgi:hypothetical protein